MSEPSIYFQQHHAVLPPAIDRHTFRTHWERCYRINKLHLTNVISWFEWRAAQEFAVLVETVRAGEYPARSFDAARGSKGFDHANVRWHDANKRLDKVRHALGAREVDLLEKYIVDDETWKVIGKWLRVHPRTARKRTVKAIKALPAAMWDA